MPTRKAPSARILKPSPRSIAMLARRLRAGELVAVPTETVYGLAANALDATACARIFRAKGRPRQDPLIVHLHSTQGLADIAVPNPAALKLARAFWPGPLTMVLPKRQTISDLVTAGRPSVAVRVPAHPVFRRLLKVAGIPLAAPSANPFGYVSPTTAAHVKAGLGLKIRHILDGGPSQIGLESTIVDLRDSDRPVILRPGAITAEQIARVLGSAVSTPRKASSPKANSHGGQLAPGLLARHYSPRTPVVLHASLPAPESRDPRQAYVSLRRPRGTPARNLFWFDVRGNLSAVARRLFATLRSLDEQSFDTINVELAPEKDLGIAINDRLRRAATR